MAIQKIKELSNATSGNYWVAEPKTNMVTKKTDVLMLLFKDKEARDSGKNFLERVRVDSINGIYLGGETVYAAVKASVLVEVTPAVEAVEGKDLIVDDEGNVTQELVLPVEGKDAVLEETNWFADATDILDEEPVVEE